MAHNRSGVRNRKLTRISFVFTILIVACAALYLALTNSSPAASPAAASGSVSAGAEMSVMFIDVGQADSNLVCFGADEVMLIDAGESEDAASVKQALNERGITKIDVLIATHPHADHIGGMAEIISSYDIGCVYMPDMQSDSKVFKNLKKTIEDRKIPLTTAFAGESFELGPADCTIVSPGKNDDKDANNESVVLMVDYLDTEFLFTGDAEKWADTKMLEAGYAIDADVLKVGHHGSNTSTPEALLKAVSPDYAVISCGKDNDYGHPHKETLDLLNEYRVNTLRTDILGDVLFLSDGHTLKAVLGD